MIGIALIAGLELVILGLRLAIHILYSFLLSFGVWDTLIDWYILAGSNSFDCP